MKDTRPPAADSQIFVLDIGTRSVVGIAGHREGERFVAEAWAMEGHPRRAMIDGQIEDIEQVARVAGLVRGRIEEQLGVAFSSVSVAAAGRALKTCRARAEADFPAAAPITMQMVYALENEAVNRARAELDGAAGEEAYHCVGHSAVRYLLDGYPLATLLEHTGGLAEVEVIATFLPSEVVDSLHRCMDLLHLSIDTMTLEPIAAMRAVIPQDLRLLNLALVDIGAGTSDIALSAHSTVSGYTMATVAGDEVTEALIKQFLVDFQCAEQLKLALEAGGPFAFTDILGFAHEPAAEEIAAAMEPAVEALAKVIADKILECNGAAPAAVFMVGGGSRTQGLCQKVAQGLGLAENKVAVAGTQFSGRVLNEASGLDGPEFATPVGIALVAADNAANEGAVVTVNEKKVRLFSAGGTSVMDALLAGGYRYSDLMGRNGRSLAFTLNGGRCVVRGGPYTAAELSVNGRPASLSTPVQTKDAIGIVKAQSGRDADALIADYAEGEAPIHVSLNGRPLLAGLIAQVNGAAAAPGTPIAEGDDVKLFILRTVGELCDAARIPTAGTALTVNGLPATPQTRMRDGDVIEYRAAEAAGAPGPTVPEGGTDIPVPVSPKAENPAAAAPSTESPPNPAEPPPPEGGTDTPAPVSPKAENPAAAAPSTAAPLSPAEPPPPEGGTDAPVPVSPKAENPAAAMPSTAAPPNPAEPPPPVGGTDAPAPVSPKAENPAAAMPSTAAPPNPADPPPLAEGAVPSGVFGEQLRKAVRPGRVRRNLFGTPTQKPDLSLLQPPAEPQAPPMPGPEAGDAPAGAADPPAPAAPPAPQKAPSPADAKAPLAPPAGDRPLPEEAPAVAPPARRSLRIQLNGKTVVLPPKPTGEAHRLFDMLTLVDIDPQNPKGMVRVLVNGKEAPYLEELVNGDVVDIGWEKD